MTSPGATGATAELDMISMVSDRPAEALDNSCLVCHFVILRCTWSVLPQMEDKAYEQGERQHKHPGDGGEQVMVGSREDHRDGDDWVKGRDRHDQWPPPHTDGQCHRAPERPSRVHRRPRGELVGEGAR